ncbi:DUF346 domain-containing protein [Streptomyces thermospinosisporus]|uniref:DUF346 domain-containing protein n=2 Tax=Streptomyces thermospinosisporus TaxID=161482 RepID=A0ABN1YW29_9ACTN
MNATRAVPAGVADVAAGRLAGLAHAGEKRQFTNDCIACRAPINATVSAGSLPAPCPGHGRDNARPSKWIKGIRIAEHRRMRRSQMGAWTEIEGGGATPSGPAGIVSRDRIRLAARGFDNRVYINVSDGGPFGTWENNLDGFSASEPAYSLFHDAGVLFVRGMDDRIYNGGAGTPDFVEVEGGGLTGSAPAALGDGPDLHLFVRGTDDRIYHNQARSDTPFGTWVEVEGAGLTSSEPGAVMVGDVLHLYVRGTDDRIYHNRAPRGQPFSGWAEVEGGGLTSSGPAPVAFNGSVHLFVRGTDNRIYRNTGDGDHFGAPWVEVEGSGMTLSRPAPVVFNGAVHLFVRGTDNRFYRNRLDT